MSFKSWLTGKPSQSEIDLQVGEAKSVIDSLSKVSKVTIPDAANSVQSAVTALNNVHGINEVGSYNFNAQEIFSSMSDILTNKFEVPLQNDVDEIEKFNSDNENTPWLKRVGATILMAGANIGEGFLSAFEDIGDAACIVGAWGSKLVGAEGLSQGLQDLAAKDLSHNLFDKIYYSSDLAKASYFTEDSGAASIFRGVGQASAYLTMGGWLAGSSEALSAAGKGGKLVQALTSTTKANTLVAAVGGLGSGSEIGLQNGLGLGKATLVGAKEAAIQGALAFGAGKLGEHFNKRALAKEAQNAIDKADDAFKTAKAAADKADDALTTAKKDLQTALDARNVAAKEYDIADDALKTAKNDLEAAKKAINPIGKSAKVAKAEQAVKDAESSLAKATTKYDATKAAVDAARTQEAALETSAKAARATADKADDVLKSAKQALTDIEAGKGVQGYTDKATELGRNKGLRDGQIRADKLEKIGDVADDASLLEKAGAGLKKAGAGVKAEVEVVGKDAKDILKAATHPLKTAKGIGTETIGAVTTAAGQASTLGKIAAGSTAYVAGNALKDPVADLLGADPDKEQMIFINETREAAQNKEDLARVKAGGTPSPTPVPTQSPTPTPSPTQNPTPTPNPTQNPTPKPTTTEGTSENPFATEPGTTESNDVEDDGTEDYNYSPSDTYYPGGVSYPQAEAAATPTLPEEVEEPTSLETEEVTVPEVVTPTPTAQPITSTIPIGTTAPTTPPTTITTPATTQAPVQTVVTTSSNGYPSGSTHSGGGYSESDGFTSDDLLEEVTPTEPELDDLVEDASASIDEIINGTTSVTKIPSSSTPVATPTSSSKGNAFVPIAAGISAAAAAGLGAKAYLDRKKNRDNGEEEEYEDDWTDSDNIEIDEDQTSYHEEYLNDEFNKEEEKYDARTNAELADIQ